MADDILQSIIGKPTGTTVVTVERGQLALFATAVKSDSPIYTDPRAAADLLPGRLALQGNLDPLALIAGGRALDEGVARVRAGFEGRAHIFNLGHGILPETPIAHVERLMELVRRTS